MATLFDRVMRLEAEAVRLLARMSHGERADDPAHITRRTGAIAPLSFAQERLWFVEQMHPGSAAYNLRLGALFGSVVPEATIAAVIAALGRRHAALRTRVLIRDGSPVQWIEDDDLALEIVRVEDPEARAATLAREYVTPFDPNARLTRAVLVVDPTGGELALSMHHLVGDGWSLTQLRREFDELFGAAVRGQPLRTEEPSLRYTDYTAWQREVLTEERSRAQLDRWVADLEGLPLVRVHPTRRMRAPIERRAGAWQAFRIAGPAVAALDDVVRRLATTRFAVLASLLAGLWVERTGESDGVLGTPAANRVRPELHDIVGFFVNMLPLRVRASRDDSLLALVVRTTAEVHRAFERQELPLERLVHRLAPARSLAVQPLLQLVLAYQDFLDEPPENAPNPAPGPAPCEAKFELTVSAHPAARGVLDMQWEYRADLYDDDEIRALATRFRELLEAWCAAPERTLASLGTPCIAGAASATEPPPERPRPLARRARGGSHRTDGPPPAIQDGAGAPDVARALARVGRGDALLAHTGLPPVSGRAIHRAARAWRARLGLTSGARIASSGGPEADLLACALVCAAGGAWCAPASADLLVTTPAGLARTPTGPATTIALLGHVLDPRAVSDRVARIRLVWTLASGTVWGVEGQPGRERAWPCGELLEGLHVHARDAAGRALPDGCLGELMLEGALARPGPRLVGRVLDGARIELRGERGAPSIRGETPWLPLAAEWLAQQPAIATAQLTVDDGRLTVAVEPAPGNRLDPRLIAKRMGQQLGECLRPDHVHVGEPGGAHAPDDTPDDDNAHDDAITALMRRIWRETLQQPDLGLDDDFFDSGGTSIRSLELFARIRDLLDVEVPFHLVFEAPTARLMAAAVRELRGSATAALPSPSGAAGSTRLAMTALAPDEVRAWVDGLDARERRDAIGDLTGGALAPEDPVIARALLGELAAAELRGGRIGPASLQQERLWFAEQLQPGTAANHVPIQLSFDARLEVADVERALAALARRHPALRTSLRMIGNEVVQEVHPASRFPLGVEDLGTRTPVDAAAQIAQAGPPIAAAPFDLEHGPLVRAHLWQEHDRSTLLLVAHHAICDGWSLSLMRGDLARLLAHPGEPLPDRGALAPIDYAIQQRLRLAADGFAPALAYFDARLRAMPDPLTLPADRPRPEVLSRRARTRLWFIPAPVLEALHALGARRGATLFLLVLGSVAVTLARLAGVPRVVFGTPVADRTRAELAAMVGYLVDMLPLAVDLSDDPTIEQLVERLRDVAQAYAHRELPFVLLSRALGRSGRRSHHPVFQVAVSLQEREFVGRFAEAAFGDGAASVTDSEAAAAFDLTATFVELERGLAVSLEYATDLFSDETAALIANHLDAVLCALPHDDHHRIGALITDDAPAAPVPAEPCPGLLERLRDHARAGLAFTDELSYAALVAAVEARVSSAAAPAPPGVAAIARIVEVAACGGALAVDGALPLSPDAVARGARRLSRALDLAAGQRFAYSGALAGEAWATLAAAWAGARWLTADASDRATADRVLLDRPDAGAAAAHDPARTRALGPWWDAPARGGLVADLAGGWIGTLEAVPGAHLVLRADRELVVDIVRDGRPQPRGVHGQLRVRGPGLPTGGVAPGALGWQRADGAIVVVALAAARLRAAGSCDPELLQLAARQLPGVADAVVRVDEAGTLEVVVTQAPTWRIVPAALAGELASRLGAAYRPDRVTIAIAVAGFAAARHVSADLAAPAAPVTALEASLARIWQETLGRPIDDLDRNFFDFGGTSLQMVRIVGRLRDERGLAISLPLFFEHPTLRALASLIRGDEAPGATSAATHDDQPLPPIRHVELAHGPLGHAQERLWFLDQLHPGSAAYNMATAIPLRPGVDPATVARAIELLVRRHPALRTRIVAGGGIPIQIVAAPEQGPRLDRVSLAELPPAERGAAALALARVEALAPFDLERGPVFRARLFEFGADGAWLSLVVHHAVCDGWSVQILLRDLERAWQAATGGPAMPPDPPISYLDYCRWQRTWIRGQRLERALRGWIDHLRGAPAQLPLPFDRPRPRVPTHAGATQRVALGGPLAARITELARGCAATPFAVALAGFAVLLARWSGERDLVIGTPVANRDAAELADVVGLIANTLPLRVTLDDVITFADLVAHVAREVRRALNDQEVPFERLVEELQPARSLDHNPIFQVMIAWQDFGGPSDGAPPDDPASTIVEGTSRFDLTLFFHPRPEGMLAELEYSTELFDHTTASRLLRQLCQLLAAAVAQPSALALGLPLEPARAVPPLAHATGPRATRSLQELVADQCARTPDRLALVGDGVALRYSELAVRAARIAAGLARHGVARGDRVALCLPSSPDTCLAILGVLWRGACYVPIDPEYPHARRAFMLADTAPRLVVCDRAIDLPLPPGVSAIHGDALAEGDGPVPAPHHGVPLDEVYRIYTSGSTGRPKGIAMPQRPLLELVAWQRGRPGAPAAARTAQLTSPSFDVSFQELLCTWTTGGTLVHLAPRLRRDPEALLAALREHEVARLFLPYVALQQLAEAVRGLSGGALPPLVEVITAGEQLRITPAIRALFTALPAARLTNQYGPSETHVVTEHVLEGPPETWPLLPPIGRAVAGAVAYVVDPQGRPAPPGITGELWIGGSALAHGYAGRAGETAARFTPDPCGAPGARLYRTGDLARQREDGVLEFIGRRDGQVKISGFRVEPGEIEAHLVALPFLREAVVIARPMPDGMQQLVAYVVPAPDAPGAVDPVVRAREILVAELPSYLVPAHIVAVAELPLTASGKLARDQLPAPEAADARGEPRDDAPPTGLGRTVERVWSALLAVPRVSSGMNFFALGGQSLTATLMAARLSAAIGFKVPVRMVFEYPRMGDFTASVASEIVEQLHRTRSIPLLDELEQRMGLEAK
jgi:amino acid adenylation domain-containing protein